MPSVFSLALSGVPAISKAAAAMRLLEEKVKQNIARYAASELTPEWQTTVMQHTRSDVDRLVLGETSRMSVSGASVRLQSAMSGKSLSHGFPITQKDPYGYATIEFGTNRDKLGLVKGKRAFYYRHTARQMPPRISKGRVVYPSAKVFVPRVASLMIQTLARTFHEVFDGTE